MRQTFILRFEEGMPKGTAQQKGYNRQTGQYFKKKSIRELDEKFVAALLPFRPEPSKRDSTKPFKMTVWFFFDVKKKSLWNKYKTTRPDTDNLVKELKDIMCRLGWFADDSQVVDERVVKSYAEKASILVVIEDLPEEVGK